MKLRNMNTLPLDSPVMFGKGHPLDHPTEFEEGLPVSGYVFREALMKFPKLEA